MLELLTSVTLPKHESRILDSALSLVKDESGTFLLSGSLSKDVILMVCAIPVDTVVAHKSDSDTLTEPSVLPILHLLTRSKYHSTMCMDVERTKDGAHLMWLAYGGQMRDSNAHCIELKCDEAPTAKTLRDVIDALSVSERSKTAAKGDYYEIWRVPAPEEQLLSTSMSLGWSTACLHSISCAGVRWYLGLSPRSSEMS